jgi:hypothetical protein
LPGLDFSPPAIALIRRLVVTHDSLAPHVISNFE